MSTRPDAYYTMNNTTIQITMNNITYILDSLDATPPVTLATRKLVNSVFNSSSCLKSSFLSFVRNSEHLTFPCKLKTTLHKIHRPESAVNYFIVRLKPMSLE